MKTLITQSALFLMTLLVVFLSYASASEDKVEARRTYELSIESASKEERTAAGKKALTKKILDGLNKLGCTEVVVAPVTCAGSEKSCTVKVQSENCVFMERNSGGCIKSLARGAPQPLSNLLKVCIADPVKSQTWSIIPTLLPLKPRPKAAPAAAAR